MPLLEVIKMGNPILRKTAVEVSKQKIDTSENLTFVNDLVDTMRHYSGVGIAAPQVGVLERIFIMEMTTNKRYPERDPFPLHVAINPVIELLGDETTDSWEGCLSIPGIRGQLKRHTRIKLSASDQYGTSYTKTFEGFPAIVAQHELDHLNGILLIDRMNSMETLTFQEEYEKYWQ